ncbi:hypothetical protein J6590_054932 [Homalodisca vitripennis]|nr:hypothetical protein J6590_054932 [Homalodisca vitripennis]
MKYLLLQSGPYSALAGPVIDIWSSPLMFRHKQSEKGLATDKAVRPQEAVRVGVLCSYIGGFCGYCFAHLAASSLSPAASATSPRTAGSRRPPTTLALLSACVPPRRCLH